MMDKEEMILAIKANDAITKLDLLITSITGAKGFSGSQFEDLFCVSEMLYRNSSFYIPHNDESFARFMEIINDKGLSTEEKYYRLVG